MTSQSENELLTAVGPGTAMGSLLRQYWVPACLSSELVADGDPLRLALLGERLIAFRDSGGRIGVFDHRCPHRCASLFFGRNEEGGLRCAYHGWKFGAQGQCLDIPTMSADAPTYEHLRARAGIVAYPTREWGDCIWAYLGPSEEAVPPLPDLEFAL